MAQSVKIITKDAQALLRTTRKYSIKQVSPGLYYHFGVEEGIISSPLKKCPIDDLSSTTLNLHINIDGLPLTKNSCSQFWPIWDTKRLSSTPPFLIGCYHGYSKPDSANAFLENFVADINICLCNGIDFNGRTFHIKLEAITCDAPARAFVKNIKGHNGYFGCDRCTQEGEHVQNRMTFPETHSRLRTNACFQSRTNEAHHTGDSILENVEGIDMIRDFPQDYMHLAYLGVMRKLVLLWLRGKLPVRLSSRQTGRISNDSLKLRKFIPQEFARKPRGLKEIDRWKSTEFRQLLLYTGPLVLKESLPKNTSLISWLLIVPLEYPSVQN
ncbi:uncharacterized protein LOC120352795 [Nilaparvata lugens]|uniref:uncharacterized protein LOC120352795 n=1 Tax=Nilaparvata lugens TaxID=108931 RepID=UPI00193D586F|nr:uncharacterized protein LOC120352795 [Nilaparvata lugens]